MGVIFGKADSPGPARKVGAGKSLMGRKENQTGGSYLNRVNLLGKRGEKRKVPGEHLDLWLGAGEQGGRTRVNGGVLTRSQEEEKIRDFTA